MGWSGGSELAEQIWEIVRDHIPDDAKQAVALDLVDLFEYEGCDTMHECTLLMEDAGLEDEG